MTQTNFLFSLRSDNVYQSISCIENMLRIWEVFGNGYKMFYSGQKSAKNGVGVILNADIKS